MFTKLQKKMTRNCCAVTAQTGKRVDVNLYNVPRGFHLFAIRRILWLPATKRADWGPDFSKGGNSLCSALFVSGMLISKIGLHVTLT